jgi:hypothetical protein
VFVSTLPSLSLASGTITNTNPALTISQTWSNTNVAFGGLLVNITNTGSASASSLQEWQEGGVTQAAMRSGGYLYLRNGRLASAVGGGYAESAVFLYNGTSKINSSNIVIGSASTGAGSAGVTLSTENGVEHVLALRNGTNPQTYNVYGSYTNATNYRRLSVGMSNSGIAYIRSEQAGPLTNASNFIYISGLPTNSAGLPSGVLWNSNGSVVVSP